MKLLQNTAYFVSGVRCLISFVFFMAVFQIATVAASSGTYGFNAALELDGLGGGWIIFAIRAGPQ